MNRPTEATARGQAFEQYASWYDAFNQGKDYAAEVRYLLERITPWIASPKSWLDIGCGTGNHLASLQSSGLSVEGLDSSAAMIARARLAHPLIRFHVGGVQDLCLEGNRDVISMLFHAVGYLVPDATLTSALRRIAAHLAPHGVFVFDFWQTEAVLRDPPIPRVREARIGSRTLFRIANPTEDRESHQVLVRYEFRWDSPDGALAHQELHVVRHFDPQEVTLLLRDAGLTVVACEAWMRNRPLGPDDWYGLICARHERSSP